ncbi:MAG: PilZ domain-containing protein [Agathobacter sp.]|nr:PilZ domain-containing protein [Agathobacter sp.]
MKIEFPELELGSRLNLHISNGLHSLEMGSTLTRHVKDHIALLTLDHNTKQVLKFDNVTIDVIYTNSEGIPYIWLNAKIVYYQGQYLLQVDPNGGRRYNRRASFRVGVSHGARMRLEGHGEIDVMVRDISLSGFSITDRRKELNLSKGTHAMLRFEDIGHELELEGYVVRIDDAEDYTIYGFVITRASRDLSSYVNTKQRRHRN